MTIPDAGQLIARPVRRVLDSLLLKWLAIYILAASVAAGPVLCDIGNTGEDLVHAVLPAFLAGFIVFHLFHRRRHARADGWSRAFETDRGTARFALVVALAAALGVLAALVAIFCPHGEPMALSVALGIWLPIMGPLYGVAIWLAIDCSVRQLGDAADSADGELRRYWRRVAASHGGRSDPR